MEEMFVPHGGTFEGENVHISSQNENFAEKTFADCSGPIIMWVWPQKFAEKLSQMVLKPRKMKKLSPSKVFHYSGTSHSDPSQQRRPPNSAHYLIFHYSGTSHSDPSQQRRPPNSAHYLRHRFTSSFTQYIGDLPGAETPQFRIATLL